MADKIIICGLNGVGKSTLGRRLSEALDCKFMDIEDYYFPKTDEGYIYASSRTRDEVAHLLGKDMKKHDNFILASVKGDYGNEIVSMFTLAVLVSAPADIRINRVKNRSFEKFGERILPGGDLYEKENSFFEMVKGRSEKYVEKWLRSVDIPVLRVDGTKPIDHNIEIITEFIEKRKTD